MVAPISTVIQSIFIFTDSCARHTRRYRETAANVTALGEKDCGDVYGDVGFYLSNHNLAYECTVCQV
jgi:hypothetical protein